MARVSRRGRVVRPTVIALTLLASALLSIPGTAAASPGNATGVARPSATYLYTLQNRHTHNCVDDSYNSGLRSYPCNHLDYQKFSMPGYDAGIGTTTIQNQHTGYCLDDSAGYGLRAIACNGQSYQAWNYIYDSSGYAVIWNNATLRVLDDSYNSGLRTYPNNPSDYQEFDIY
ncbi:RICIN domain-containing protein [Streptomyces sp. V4-01]|uniref:RICIN domain-containing protein n=1 Tax=Actinacidiphila polyblastidii TaxID=3110430 RepID=A0ABU7PE18_9ACTN|nr:RICIN domain-containing protein [Streptomyces sp. V4-01]